MKLKIYLPNCSKLLLALAVILSTYASLQAEGSKDFWGYAGTRLFYNAEQKQQLKVFARHGEFINVGASHVGITGGFINVYSPDGTLVMTFDGADGKAIINNHTEELNGPTGAGTSNGTGYEPGVVPVTMNSEGVWTIQLGFPDPTRDAFDNINNGTPWNRVEHQPTVQRSVLAWDVTVTQGAAGNELGQPIEGRVYSNEYISIQNGNNNNTSPSFYVLSKDGYIYQIDFKDTDPWGFPLFSNSFGVVNGNQQPTYSSFSDSLLTRSIDPSTWNPENNYLYDPQAKDAGSLINNKIFFNPPSADMPAKAMVTDIINEDTHTVWLYNEPSTEIPQMTDVRFRGMVEDVAICDPATTSVVGKGGFIIFTSNNRGTASVNLDIDNNGSFDDPLDRSLSAFVSEGKDSIFWDGRDGAGNVVPAEANLQLNYNITSRNGEIHIMMLDVENNSGGVTFTRLNGSDSPANDFYYDHIAVGGGVSGGEAGKDQSTTTPYTYSDRFGNDLLLDYWTFIKYPNPTAGMFPIAILESCLSAVRIDSDGDGITNDIDIDDDNDGITDVLEFCNAFDGYICPISLDPSGDHDSDNIPNYLDADDVDYKNDCVDNDTDGICDQLSRNYDLDGDQVPDHLDLDSDNDGILDLIEAGHQQEDIDQNGMIDGNQIAFGLNGLFNMIATDTNALEATISYFLSDKDKDRVFDYKDLDADNDGINDVMEGNYGMMDTNDNGRIDDGAGGIPSVTTMGIAVSIIPDTSTISIALPPDTDGDGVADWHDLDSDNDGINDVIENIGIDPDEDGVIGTGLPIVDHYGVAMDTFSLLPLSTSNFTDTDEDQIADFRDLDSDGDGIFDVFEANQPDPDNNGVIGQGAPVINRNGQGIEDVTGTTLLVSSAPTDGDNDSIPDFQDTDRDADGIPDSIECPGGWPCLDSDNDSLLDVDDLDSDGDLLMDSEECASIPCLDANNNEVANFIEFDCHSGNTPILNELLGTTFCGDTPINLVVSRADSLIDSLSFIWTGPGDFLLTGTTLTDSFTLTGVDTTGTYSLVLTTAEGCESNVLTTSFEQIETPPAPVLKLSEATLCAGQEVILTTTAVQVMGMSYEWYFDNGDTSRLIATTTDSIFQLREIKESDTGTYSVAINAEGCGVVTSEAVALSVGPSTDSLELFAFAFSEDPVCSGAPITLSVFEIGDSNTVYEWYGPQGLVATGSTIEIDTTDSNQSGVYYVAAKMGSCSIESNELDVSIKQSPSQPEIIVPAASLCAGQEFILNATEVKGDSVSYEWYFDNGTTSELLSVTSDASFQMDSVQLGNAGDYSVIAVDGGCPSSTSFPSAIVVQTLSIEASSSIGVLGTACAGTPIEFEVSTLEGASYEWFGPNGSFSTEVAPNIMDATSGTYYAVATLGACTAESNEVDLLINTAPATPQILTAKEEFCHQETIELAVENAETTTTNYDWYLLQNDTLNLITTTEIPNYRIENTSDNNTGYYLVIAKAKDCVSDPSLVKFLTVQPSLVLTPTSTAMATSPACSGEEIAFSVPEIRGATYEWYGPNGLLSRQREPEVAVGQPNMSGPYYAIVTSGGCAETTEPINVLINGIPGVPELSVSQNDFCSGETIQLNATITNGQNIQYDWYFDNGSDQQLIESTEQPTFFIDRADIPNNGQYSVEVTVDGCISSSSNVQQISVEEALGSLKASSNATLSSPACSGERVIITATGIDGAEYEWFGPKGMISRKRGFTIPNAASDVSGKYYAKITLGGCTKLTNEIDVLVKDQPTVPQLLTKENNLCFGDRLELLTTAYSGVSVRYNWYYDNGSGKDVLVTTTPTPNFAYSDVTEGVAGTYSVQVVVDGCTSVKSNAALIDIQSSLDKITAFSSIVSDKPVCEGETVSFFTSPIENATYKWFGPKGFFSDQPNPSILNTELDQSGEYYAIVSFDGCGSITNEVSLKVKPKPEKPEIFVEESVCAGGIIELSATTYEADEITYGWLFSDGKTERILASTEVSTFPISNITSQEDGFYGVSINVDGCTSSQSNFEKVDVQPELPGMTISSSATVANPACEGEKIDLSAPFLTGATYEWFGPSNFSSKLINPSIAESSTENAGEYFAVVTLNGCPNQTDATMVAVKEKPETPFLVAEEEQVCVGELAVLKATNSLEVTTNRALFYQWYHESTNQLIGETLEGSLQISNADRSDVGDYFVALANEGCVSELSNRVNLEVDEMPEETAFILDESSSFCAASEISVEAVQPAIGVGRWSVLNSDAAIVAAGDNNTIIRNLDQGGNTILWSLSYKGCDDFSTDTIFAFRDGSSIRAADDEYTIQINNELEPTNLLKNDLLDGLNGYEFKITKQPAFGKLVSADGMVQYTPNPNYFGSDAFEYEVCNTSCSDMCDQAAVKINIVDDNQEIQCFAPNVITPNGDGLNDGLKIPCIDELNLNSELKIFNRWGDEVYASTAYKNDWTGTYDGKQLPAGTYFYLLRLGEDQTKCLQGYFQLIR